LCDQIENVIVSALSTEHIHTHTYSYTGIESWAIFINSNSNNILFP